MTEPYRFGLLSEYTMWTRVEAVERTHYTCLRPVEGENFEKDYLLTSAGSVTIALFCH